MRSLGTIGSRLMPAAALVVVAPLLAGCGGLGLAVAGANVVSFSTSGKSLVDHAMSVATQQDCSIRHDHQGQSYCVPITEAALVDDGLRCYRSLAEVTCYTGEHPYETPTRRVE